MQKLLTAEWAESLFKNGEEGKIDQKWLGNLHTDVQLETVIRLHVTRRDMNLVSPEHNSDVFSRIYATLVEKGPCIVHRKLNYISVE